MNLLAIKEFWLYFDIGSGFVFSSISFLKILLSNFDKLSYEFG